MWISTLCWCQSSLLRLTVPLYWQSLLPPQNFVNRLLFLEVSETGTHIQPFNRPIGQEFFWSTFQWFSSCSSLHLRPSVKSKNHADVKEKSQKQRAEQGERGVRELKKDPTATHPGCGDTDSDVKPQAPEYSGISSARQCLISLLPSKQAPGTVVGIPISHLTTLRPETSSGTRSQSSYTVESAEVQVHSKLHKIY